MPLDDGHEGTINSDGSVRGTTLHGLFEHDGFRGRFLEALAMRRGKRFVSAGISFRAERERRFDVIADAIEEHLDTDMLYRLVAAATD